MEAVLSGRISSEREKREKGREERKGKQRRALSFIGLGLDPSPPPAFPPSLTLERFQGSTRLPKSELLNVFATSFIVYGKQAKPLKLNRGSVELYMQTPINTASWPRLAPEFPFKARGV